MHRPDPSPTRTLHFVDIENLLGAAHRCASQADVTALLWRYQRLARYRCGDLTIIGSNPSELAFNAKRAWPGSLLVMGGGPHGAERAMLESVSNLDLPRRFDRVCVGSGDGAYADLAANLRESGVVIHTVARYGSISHALKRHATRVSWINTLPSATAAAQAA